MKKILAYGGGVDSTAILSLILAGKLEGVDAVVFADPGAEFAQTYATVELARQLCEAAGILFIVVRHHKDTIITWLNRNGTVPVMPGGPHVCSLKFKGEPMQKWAEQEYPGEQITWLIGIEANEGRRAAFTPPKGSKHQFEYPLVELGLTREDCQQIVAEHWAEPVRKSSCVFCPFMSQCEIADMIGTPDWETAKQIESDFEATSARKHQAWIDAGQPMNGSRAPVGMWRKDSWKEGNRLFAKTVNGKQLSLPEWETEITNPAQPSFI